MILHQPTGLDRRMYGSGDGNTTGDGALYPVDHGDGCIHGDGDGDGVGEVEAHEWRMTTVQPCVSQMYLLAQVLEPDP